MNAISLHSRSFAVRCVIAFVLFLAGAQTFALAAGVKVSQSGQRLQAIADDYYDGYFDLFPLLATENLGDPKYEAAFEVDIAPAHRLRQRLLYQRTLAALRSIDRRRLTRDERVTCDLLKYESERLLRLLAFPSHLLPLSQMDGMPVRMAQWASGNGAQPMKTVANYEHYLARLRRLPAWITQAVANMEEGMTQGIVQPRPLVERLLPQIDALLPADPEQSPYLQATVRFPESISAADQATLRQAYRDTVVQSVAPALQGLRTFLTERYLPRTRESAGLGVLPQGAAWYRALVRDSTTTDMTVDQIHELGLKEVARIRGEMERVKTRLGFDGDLKAFFQWVDTRAELTPFSQESEVLAAYAALNTRVMAGLPRLFERAPKALLDIRAVEAMRRDAASDYYSPPATDGSRPGVFYVVVQDPTKYATPIMTALFLHEGQPGHHYQLALQQELRVPKFRQSVWYDAYGEGWALYAEGLGRELGLYDDPYAYLGRLFMELHRALRLVVDTGLHAKGWSREHAIGYLMEMEGSKENSARQAVERYMAWPGQALAYKVGELRILALRERVREKLGPRFDLRAFHTQILADGAMPLWMLEAKVQAWLDALKQR